jgi:hypothetical protein
MEERPDIAVGTFESVLGGSGSNDGDCYRKEAEAVDLDPNDVREQGGEQVNEDSDDNAFVVEASFPYDASKETLIKERIAKAISDFTCHASWVEAEAQKVAGTTQDAEKSSSTEKKAASYCVSSDDVEMKLSRAQLHTKAIVRFADSALNSVEQGAQIIKMLTSNLAQKEIGHALSDNIVGNVKVTIKSKEIMDRYAVCAGVEESTPCEFEENGKKVHANCMMGEDDRANAGASAEALQCKLPSEYDVCVSMGVGQECQFTKVDELIKGSCKDEAGRMMCAALDACTKVGDVCTKGATAELATCTVSKDGLLKCMTEAEVAEDKKAATEATDNGGSTKVTLPTADAMGNGVYAAPVTNTDALTTSPTSSDVVGEDEEVTQPTNGMGNGIPAIPVVNGAKVECSTGPPTIHESSKECKQPKHVNDCPESCTVSDCRTKVREQCPSCVYFSYRADDGACHMSEWVGAGEDQPTCSEWVNAADHTNIFKVCEEIVPDQMGNGIPAIAVPTDEPTTVQDTDAPTSAATVLYDLVAHTSCRGEGWNDNKDGWPGTTSQDDCEAICTDDDSCTAYDFTTNPASCFTYGHAAVSPNVDDPDEDGVVCMKKVRGIVITPDLIEKELRVGEGIPAAPVPPAP